MTFYKRIVSVPLNTLSREKPVGPIGKATFLAGCLEIGISFY